MPSMEDLAKSRGFADLKEMDSIISRINLMDPAKWEAFLCWADENGSKADLLLLVEGTEAGKEESHDCEN